MPASLFPSFSNRGHELVAGQPCYRVEVMRRCSTEADQIFFSIASGIPTRTIGTRKSPSGNREIYSTVTQYDTFDGLTIATRIRQTMQDFNTVHDVKNHIVEINGKIDSSLFEPPADLQ